MTLSETNFRVLFNEAFVKLLDVDQEQIAWMAREASKMLTDDKWDTNIVAHMMSEELDCWQHDMLLRSGQKIVIEGVPYPKGFMILWTPQYEATLPKPGSPTTKYMDYPKDFLPYLHKDRKELGVFKEGEGVTYGPS